MPRQLKVATMCLQALTGAASSVSQVAANASTDSRRLINSQHTSVLGWDQPRHNKEVYYGYTKADPRLWTWEAWQT